MAQQLAAAGEAVALLALFDSYGPHILWNHAPIRVARRTLAHLQAARRMESGARLSYLLARARGVRKKVNRRIWQARYRLYHRRGRHLPDDLREIGMTHFLAISRYLPRPYPGRLTLFSAAEQSIAAFNDRTIGWNGMAAGGVEVHVTPGNHNSILEEPQVRQVAEILGSLLARRSSQYC
jgi:thioesterase domain-containing protein